MIAYGLTCVWWDIASRARVERSLAGDRFFCPRCGGQCATHADRESFLRMARRFELIGFAGHHDVMAWAQGRCFKNLHEAGLAHRTRLLQLVS